MSNPIRHAIVIFHTSVCFTPFSFSSLLRPSSIYFTSWHFWSSSREYGGTFSAFFAYSTAGELQISGTCLLTHIANHWSGIFWKRLHTAISTNIDYERFNGSGMGCTLPSVTTFRNMLYVSPIKKLCWMWNKKKCGWKRSVCLAFALRYSV